VPKAKTLDPEESHHNDSDGDEQQARQEQKKQLKFLFKCGDDLR